MSAKSIQCKKCIFITVTKINIHKRNIRLKYKTRYRGSSRCVMAEVLDYGLKGGEFEL